MKTGGAVGLGRTMNMELHDAVGSSSLFCRVRPCAVIFVALAKYTLLSGCGL